MSEILEVKKLRVSFRTSAGTVKAVRDISFRLNKGETLAIVGESGSGKSVTSKAILGILSGNAIVEGGEIFFEGRDLLKLSESEMCKIRGDKISMIFQDPLSSLDPIVKIGPQITEAMILKNKLSRKKSRSEFNSKLKSLKMAMIEALGNDEATRSEIDDLILTFDKFNIEAIRLENAYNNALVHSEELIGYIEEKLLLIEKKQRIDIGAVLTEIRKALSDIQNPFLTSLYDGEIDQYKERLRKMRSEYSLPKYINIVEREIPKTLVEELVCIKKFLLKVNSGVRPIFFRIGYYKYKNPNEALNGDDISGLNKRAYSFLMNDFMTRFIELERKAIEYSFERSIKEKEKLLSRITDAKEIFNKGGFDKSGATSYIKGLCAAVDESVYSLACDDDNYNVTFRHSINSTMNNYLESVLKKDDTSKDLALESVVSVLDGLYAKCERDISNADKCDHDKMVVDLIDFFKEKASDVVYRVTKKLAKEKAIRLMEEVGIPDPRLRFDQYPFEFSGGMRQRIVIAIALAANPDILICDEPTTALDVTIQAQILELIDKLKRERGLSVIFITHDLGVVANIADKIAVMYAGKIVEYGECEEVFYDPRHPYSWALLSSMPSLDSKDRLDAIPGTPPNMIYPPKGDAFAPRNKYALKIDFEVAPPMFRISETHYAATWLLHPDAPRIEPQIPHRACVNYGGENVDQKSR